MGFAGFWCILESQAGEIGPQSLLLVARVFSQLVLYPIYVRHAGSLQLLC